MVDHVENLFSNLCILLRFPGLCLDRSLVECGNRWENLVHLCNHKVLACNQILCNTFVRHDMNLADLAVA